MKVTILLLLTLTGTNAQTIVCGEAPLNNRIVGGANAADGAWPWQVSLQFTGSHFCGGTLINDNWILSAAHCFPQLVMDNPQNVTIVLGRNALDTQSANEAIRTVSRIIRHEAFSSSTFDNDVAVVEMNQTVVFSNYIRAVCLAKAGSTNEAGTAVWLTGWGTMNASVPLPPPRRLQEVSVSIVDHTSCVNSYSSLTAITNNMICAGLNEGGKDTCEGDSGGPMVSKMSSRWVQRGIISFGRGCAQPGFPRVFTEVARYETWITQNAGTNTPGFITTMDPTAAPAATTTTTTTTTPAMCHSSGVLHLASLSLSVLPVLFALYVL